MQRTNSFRRPSAGELDETVPNPGTEERDTLLSRSNPGSGSQTPDLEAGGRSGRNGNGNGNGSSLLPSFVRGGSSNTAKKNGKKRRDSNEIFLDPRRAGGGGGGGGGVGGGYRRSEREHQQQRRLCTLITLLFIPLTLVLLLFTGTLHIRIPFLKDPHNHNPHPPTSGNGDGRQKVPIPISNNNGTFTLPPPTNKPRNEAFWTQGEKGVVASEDAKCSEMGVQILERGGNAVDAAITTCLCIGTLNSFSSGLGGGGFMVIRAPPRSEFSSLLLNDKETWSNTPTYLSPEGSPFFVNITHTKDVKDDTTSTLIAIDFRETAPHASTPNMYLKAPPGSSQVGGLSVGVPGEVRGLYTAFEMYGSGRLRWNELVEPVVELAKGWRVSRELARRFRIYGSFMEGRPEWEDVFRPYQQMLVEGDYMSRHNYSRALASIAEYGPDVFYGKQPGQGKDDESNGHAWIAKDMVETIRKEGGVMTMDDLRGYKVRVYEPMKTTYQGKTIWTTDAPSCGPVMLGMFNLMEHYNLHPPADLEFKSSVNGTRTGLNMHRITEAMKFAFGARTEIGDPDPAFMDEKRRERVTGFAQREWAERIGKELNDNTTHTAEYYHPVFDSITDSGTTHMSIADRWGGAVSLTSTVNLIFGSRVMDRSTGIIMNDEMDDFSIPGKINAFGLKPSPYNYPEPGKRPLSSTSATIIERADGTLFTAIGGSGGSRIFGAVAQVLFNMEWGMDVMSAIEAPRLHDQLFPASVTLETAFEAEFVDALKERGHNVTLFDINLGVAEVQAVVRHQNGTLTGASDSRKNGRAWAF